MGNNVDAARIRRLRREAGLTQEELAKKINVTRSCVANWECGGRRPECVYIMKMAFIFKVPIDYLYGLSDRRYNINLQDRIELDLLKLNALGVEMLCDYFKYLAGNPKYSANPVKNQNNSAPSNEENICNSL